jgi:trans-2,3-dihydro-3-hydroxyanthranilate isomerase
VPIVSACLRDGRGGSATAVVSDADLSEAQRRAVPVRAGTSHAVFLSPLDPTASDPVLGLRFFTSAGELPACGHGTVAALALVAEQQHRALLLGMGAVGSQETASPDVGGGLTVTLNAGGRTFAGQAARVHGGGTAAHSTWEASFDPGPVRTRRPTSHELSAVLRALGQDGTGRELGAWIASVGRERILIPIPDCASLSALAPDFEALREACDRFGLLGCYVHTPAADDGRMAARMFAPSIGVPEDIANANGTACLAAVLAREGLSRIAVDMGDSLASPATVIASTAAGRSGLTVRVGGVAALRQRRPSSCAADCPGRYGWQV